jgi:N-acetyl-gamma-glutamyl-phosphate reductase
MTRGILATCYARLKRGAKHLTHTAISALYRDYYAHEPFVRVIDEPPHTKWTLGSNCCLLHLSVDVRTGRLLVISCLDNLVKGAAGQAVQNANRLWSLPEASGLTSLALYP